MCKQKKAPHGRPDLINYKLFATVPVTTTVIAPFAKTIRIKLARIA